MQMMQKLDILQETVDNQVIPKLDECCVSACAPKAGQITSYEAGEDGDLQKGLAWPDPKFTDNVDGTVTDNMTGLM